MPLESAEERLENGVGVGMGEVKEGMDFDWMDFRLGFGCQTKVRVVSLWSRPFDLYERGI